MAKSKVLSKKEFLAQVKKYSPTVDLAAIGHAFDWASTVHADEYRASGDPYIVHPIATALTLARMKLDTSSIMGGLLHDTMEKDGASFRTLEREFGPEVANLVRGVSLVSNVRNYNRETVQIKTVQRMFLAMAKDIRVVLIKLADRLHNMQTLGYKHPEKAHFKAQQTLDIYVPLADRLQLSGLKQRLEDLAFRNLYPNQYKWLKNYTDKALSIRKQVVQNMQREVASAVRKNGIRILFTQGRVKSKYRLWLKLQRYNMDLSQIYDLIACRIVVSDVQSCYAVLKIIHDMYTPVREVKDYIATPKLNGYRSLHTTVKSSSGDIIEFQIRTPRMHHEAEHGIAAHWAYADLYHKEQTKNDRLLAKEMEWVRQLAHWREKAVDNEEYLELLKIDFFQDRIYVKTPKNDIFDLPEGSTPIDFAYRIHTMVGHYGTGCTINGHEARLNQPLKNGDQVYITVDKKSPGPRLEWLDFVRTTNARSQIRAWLRQKDARENIAAGRKIIDQEIRLLTKHSLDTFLRIMPFEEQKIILKANGYPSWERLFEAVGNGTLTFAKIFHHTRENIANLAEFSVQEKIRKLLNITHVTERNVQPVITPALTASNTQYYPIIARCCKPKMPTPIVGYITRKGNIIVHRTSCPVLRDIDQLRIFTAEWKTIHTESDYIPVEISLHNNDRNALNALQQELWATGVKCTELRSLGKSRDSEKLFMRLQVNDLAHFLRACRGLRLLAPVKEIRRV